MTGQHEITYLFTGFQMRSEMFVTHGNFRVLSPSVWLIKVVKFCHRKFRTSKSVYERRGKKILENTESSAIARNSGIFRPSLLAAPQSDLQPLSRAGRTECGRSSVASAQTPPSQFFCLAEGASVHRPKSWKLKLIFSLFFHLMHEN